MFQLIVPANESYDEANNTFIEFKGQKIQVEHSLVSISKWEAIWLKPFLGKEPQTKDETIDYIRCMTITQNVKPDVYINITEENIKEIGAYIKHPMSATWFNKDIESGTGAGTSSSKETITSELIYYWMITYVIPIECQKWHLNRLLTLIRVCDKKNSKPKKKSTSEIMSRNRALNAERRAKSNSKG